MQGLYILSSRSSRPLYAKLLPDPLSRNVIQRDAKRSLFFDSSPILTSDINLIRLNRKLRLSIRVNRLIMADFNSSCWILSRPTKSSQRITIIQLSVISELLLLDRTASSIRYLLLQIPCVPIQKYSYIRVLAHSARR